jgi:tetratricopeptide (TPR) repeat protein
MATEPNVDGETPTPEAELQSVLGSAEPSLGSPGAVRWWRHPTVLLGIVVLGLVIVLGVGTVLYRMLVCESESPEASQVAAGIAEPQASVSGPAPKTAQAPAPGAEAAPQEGFSWDQAEQAYAARRWDDALRLYAGLLARCETSAANTHVSDFLRLRIAACHKHLDRPRPARQLLLEAADSGSPIVRAAACRELALADAAEGQPLQARMRAYQAIAVLGAVAGQSALQGDCEFAVAQAMTQRTRAFFNNTASLPRCPADETDPFKGLPDADLRRLLDEGSDRLAAAALSPQVRRMTGDGAAYRWAAVACGAPLEEFLGRLVAQSGMSIRWQSVDAAARRRPVILCLSDSTDQRLVEVACAAAGLVARFTGTEAVIHDPSACTSVNEQQDLLVREAISTWRRFFLRASDDNRLACGRFSLAALYEQAGDSGAAMTEYRIIAERFPSDRLAPVARLRIATLRLDLRDYPGARQELLDLLNRYPDCPSSDEVYLRLGQATMEAGRLDEAIQTFKKLYFLDLSLASQAGASLGAAQCHFRKGQYNDAAVWLMHRIDLARAPEDPSLAEPYGLLAKTEAARGRFSHAVQAYKRALACAQQAKEPADAAWRVEMLLELAHTLLRQEDFVSALGILESLSPKDAAPKQADEILLAKAEILREMRLPERALALLRCGIVSASSPQTGSRMTVELARCLADSDDLEGARQVLADAVPKMEAGPLARGAAVDLAELCLKTGRNDQAAGVCREVLKAQCSDDIRRRAQNLLAAAYAREKDYERAAMALSGKVPDEQGARKP